MGNGQSGAERKMEGEGEAERKVQGEGGPT